MTSVTSDVQSSTEVIQTGTPSLTTKFEYMVTLAAFWLIFGVHIDGWAHNNLPSSLESFFTPWHGILYTGFFALAAVLLFEMFGNIGKGYSWSNAMPQGFLVSIIGIIIFGLGGFGDGVWHTFLGIEETVDALYSPTHLMLAIGAALMFTGPIRNAWSNPEEWNKRTFTEKVPTLATFSFFISILFFFHQYAVPLHSIFPSLPLGDISSFSVFFYNEAAGMAGILLFSIIIATMFLKINNKFELPIGSNVLIFGIITVFGTMMRFPIGQDAVLMEQLARVSFFFLALTVGFILDLIHNSQWSQDRKDYFYTIGSTFLFFTGYVTILSITIGMVYSIHLVLGIPFVAGLVGYLVKLSHID